MTEYCEFPGLERDWAEEENAKPMILPRGKGLMTDKLLDAMNEDDAADIHCRSVERFIECFLDSLTALEDEDMEMLRDAFEVRDLTEMGRIVGDCYLAGSMEGWNA